MNKTGSAAKVKLNSFDDLFGDGQPQAGIEQVQEIALSELYEFKGHPFKVLDDEKMQETVESVREHGAADAGGGAGDGGNFVLEFFHVLTSFLL